MRDERGGEYDHRVQEQQTTSRVCTTTSSSMPPASLVWNLVAREEDTEHFWCFQNLKKDDPVWDKASTRRGRLLNGPTSAAELQPCATKSVQAGSHPSKRSKTTAGGCSDEDIFWTVSYDDDDASADYQQVSRRQLIPIFCERQLPQQQQEVEASTDGGAVPILVTPDTDTFRILACSQLVALQKQHGTNVLEIGSSTGEMSQLLWKSSFVKHWMGWDTGADMVQQVQRRLKQQKVSNNNTPKQKRSCHKVDPLKDPDRAASLVREQFQMPESQQGNDQQSLTIFVDIGGDRQMHAVILLLQWILDSFSSTVLTQIIVKSETLYQALRDEANDDDSDVVFDSHSAWFSRQRRIALRETMPKHPLQAARRFVITQNETKTTICRYHNYHTEGCAKHLDGGTCPYDHNHCHLCLQKGHVARACDWIQTDRHEDEKKA